MKPDIWKPDPSGLRRPRRGDEARDYARLLASDIRLFHEEDVILGRLHGDISMRLSGPIAVARERYLRRFADETLFDGEIVRILAGGAPGRLG